MPDWNLVTRNHVLSAIQECDRLERREFLRRYGFTRAKAYTLWHQGEEYDPQAIVGVAYKYAVGTPAGRADFDGEQDAANLLLDMAFDVVAEELPVAPTRTRKAAATTTAPKTTGTTSEPKPRKAAAPKATRTPKAPEPQVNICPKCYMAIPATGLCDNCD